MFGLTKLGIETAEVSKLPKDNEDVWLPYGSTVINMLRALTKNFKNIFINSKSELSTVADAEILTFISWDPQTA